MAVERKRVYGELGTLYAQCGGIFGVSAFVDRCMDKWMADPMLNANQAVATWHAKAQRCGFKFLVVQIVGQLTGGPQRYTGRPMDEAHKHLNISGAEWDKFMEIFNDVCAEFQLPCEVIGDLNALMISMEYDCVVQPGERVPPNPGPSQSRGNSLYARCGGVYPIALFVDRLVDAVLDDERVLIPCDGQKRTDVSLKYLLTELVCSIAGGPEVITAKDFEETKLLLPKAAWEIFMSIAHVAADHFPQAVRLELMQVLQRSRIYIVDSKNDTPLPTSVASVVVKDLRSAAAGKMLTSAAIAARHADPGAHIAARRRVLGDPRTLYGRGGGVFGLAKLADRLMEAWMADPALNANIAVAKWHESQQKYGFKFLVTQLLGYLTGGPQLYTGQPMEAAHKHLAITLEQWQSFIADADCALDELRVDAATQAELQSILAGFRDQCVLNQGDIAPQDPGLCRARPRGNGAYAQLGGVYPIALFADRLVAKVLQGDSVQVQWKQTDDSAGFRHRPGLKYMVTELFCHAAGGPEVVTSKGFDDAKLGIDPRQWSEFMSIAAEVASVWPTKHHRDIVLKLCEQSKAELCFGMEGQEAALPVDLPAAAVTSGAQVFKMSSQCPFSGKAGVTCPFSGQASALSAVTSIVPEKRKICDVADDASILSESTTTGGHGLMAGRLLGGALQQSLDKLLEEDPDLCCPVSLMVFTEPVYASDGFIYDKSMLLQLLGNKQRSPMTREVLKSQHRIATEKMDEAVKFRHVRSEHLIKFALQAADQQPHMAQIALERVVDYLVVIQDRKARNLAAEAAKVYKKLGQPVPSGMQQLCKGNIVSM
jgi:hemoglobin